MADCTVIWTTDQSVKSSISAYSMESIISNSPAGIRIIEIVQSEQCTRSIKAMMINIMCAMQQCDTEIVYICEHDVLYPADYFDIRDVKYGVTYASNGLFLSHDGYSVRQHPPLSALAGRREILLQAFDDKLWEFYVRKSIKWSEPSPVDGITRLRNNINPYIDIRHGNNYTGPRNGLQTMSESDYWGNASELWDEILCEDQNEQDHNNNT